MNRSRKELPTNQVFVLCQNLVVGFNFLGRGRKVFLFLKTQEDVHIIKDIDRQGIFVFKVGIHLYLGGG